MSSHTWTDLARAAAGGEIADEVAEHLLWAGSAFPFAPPRHVYYQIQHSARHGVCVDDPLASCGPSMSDTMPTPSHKDLPDA